MILDKVTGYEYSDKLNIRILDLSKIEEVENEYTCNPRLIKWAKIFKAKTLKELEMIAGDEEVLKKMVSQIKVLSEDEKIRQQLQAREDYERRMIGQYNRGTRDGIEKGKNEIILRLLQKNEYSDETIADIVGTDVNTVLMMKDKQ